jgi:hypothetical protein
MRAPLKDYFLENPSMGKLFMLENIQRTAGEPPFVTKINNAFVIGSLALFAGGERNLNALDLQGQTVNPSFSTGISGCIGTANLITEAKKMRQGAYLALHGFRSNNFWHWMMEFLVKAVLAIEAGFKGNFIIPPNTSSMGFITESLQMIGVDPNSIVAYDGRPWWVEELFVPQYINGHHEISLFPGLMGMLRERLLSSANASGSAHRRIYLTRANAVNARRVVNEADLWGALANFGFEQVAMEDLPLREQIRLAASTDCLVGPHGAGMVHCLFMPPGSIVIELFSSHYFNPCMFPVIDHLRHTYFMVPSPPIAGQTDTCGDINAYIPMVEMTLRRELEANNPSGLRLRYPSRMGCRVKAEEFKVNHSSREVCDEETAERVPVHLFVNFYRDKDPMRHRELEECLRRNLSNHEINKIYVFCNDQDATLLNGLGCFNKLIVIRHAGRPTYKEMFEEVNRRTGNKQINIVSNSDMYFDLSLIHVQKIGIDDCYLLSRWEVGCPFQVQRRGDSQDVWIFHGPVKPVPYADFTLGIPGCDNRIAYELQEAGYRVLNPSQTIKAWHLHGTNIRHNLKEIPIPRPYLIVEPTAL